MFCKRKYYLNQISIIRKMGLLFDTLTFIFVSSFVYNLYLVNQRRISFRYYLFVYYELCIMAFITVLLLFFFKQNLLLAIYPVAITDIFIQLIFQYNRKPGEKIAKKMHYLKSKRQLPHSISLQTYTFPDFKCHIMDGTKRSPSFDYLVFQDFLRFKKYNSRRKHQFGKLKVYVFDIITTDKKWKQDIDETNGFMQNHQIIERLKKIDKEIPIATAFYKGVYKTKRLRICIDKNYCLKHPKKIYNLLKTYVIKHKVHIA